MFSPNHWDSFCSELGQDLSCVGLLLVGHTLCLLHRLHSVLLAYQAIVMSMQLLAGSIPGWDAQLCHQHIGPRKCNTGCVCASAALLPSLLCCFSAQQALCTLLPQQASACSCLQEEQDEFDRERQALRSYIIKRCSKAVALMYGDLQAQQVCSLENTVWD